MTTARDIVERAHQKIGVVSKDEPMTAEDASDGLDQLNAMMHGWKLFGVDVSHSDLTLADTFPLSDEFVEGTVYQLAARLSPDFQVSGVASAVFFRALQSAYMEISAATYDDALLRMPSAIPRRRGFT